MIRKVVLKSMQYVLMLSLSRPCLFVGCLSCVKLLKVQWRCKCSRNVFKSCEEGKAWNHNACPNTDETALYQTPPLLQVRGLTSYSLRSWRSHPEEHPYAFLTIWERHWDEGKVGTIMCCYNIFQPSQTPVEILCIRDKLSHGCYCF